MTDAARAIARAKRDNAAAIAQAERDMEEAMTRQPPAASPVPLSTPPSTGRAGDALLHHSERGAFRAKDWSIV